MRGGTIFSASDKSIYDALSQKTVTNAELRELFLTRGILVSKETSRKNLARHFSRLSHDYRDYETLAKLFGSPTTRDKLSSVRIANCTLLLLENCAHELKAALENDGAIVTVNSAKGAQLDIEVKYQKLHFNKSDFRQVVNKTAVISIREDANGVIVHAPCSEDAKEWIGDLSKYAYEKTGDALKFDEIRLPLSFSSNQKTSFESPRLSRRPVGLSQTVAA